MVGIFNSNIAMNTLNSSVKFLCFMSLVRSQNTEIDNFESTTNLDTITTTIRVNISEIVSEIPDVVKVKNPTSFEITTVQSTSSYDFSTKFSNFFELSENSTVNLPKCCPFGEGVGVGNCTSVSFDFQPKFNVHTHNETAFDDVPINPDLIVFEAYVHNPCEGKKFPVSADENPKFLLNGSLLLAGFGEYDGILGNHQFCVDNLDDPFDPLDSNVYAFVCIKKQKEGYPQWVFSFYITLITISALLFSSSAAFFYQQDVQGVHKKSFMAYAISMSLTYVVIVLMQFIVSGCRVLGLILQFCLTISFGWLAILCFDLAWMVHFYKIDTRKNLNTFVNYVISTLIFSTVFLIVSMTNNLTPDIPTSFFKPQFQKTSCLNFENEQRRPWFYTALILTLTISVLSLCYTLIKMNRNRYNYTSQSSLNQWRKVSKKFRYMLFQCLLILKSELLCVVPDILLNIYEFDVTIKFSLVFFEGLHGFFILAIGISFWYYLKNNDDSDDEISEEEFEFELLKKKDFDSI